MSFTYNGTVTGMTCGHCVASVTEEVQELPGVEDVQVTLETGALAVTADRELDEAEVRAAVEEAGYQLAGRDA
jgi:copper chaperone